MMAGWVFLVVLTGACQFGHGVGGFTTNSIHSGWLPERSCGTTVIFVAMIAGMFLGTTAMFVVTTVLFLGATLVFTGGTAMFAAGTAMFTRRVTVVSVAATVMFVAADANPAFLGARRLCTRENAVS